MLGGRGIRLIAVRGIDVRVDVSWIAIAALVTWSFWVQFGRLGGQPTAVAVPMAIAGAVLFFGSVLVHELAHALEAQRRGVEVESITLFLFGGVTAMSADVERPRDAFTIAFVGPYSSLVLGAGFGLLATFTPEGPIAEVAGQLGWINVALAVFNLLPGAPLDGGRVLRAVVWGVTGRKRTSVRVAARVGQGLGALIAALGAVQLLFVPGGLVGGLWFMFIGWYLAQAAGSEMVAQEARAMLEERTLGSLFGSLPRPVSADVVLDEVIDELIRDPAEAYPVFREGEAVGVLVIDDVGKAGPSQRRQPVAEAMRSLDSIPELAAGDNAADALPTIMAEDVVAILEDGELVGLATQQQLETALRRLSRLGSDRSPAGVEG